MTGAASRQTVQLWRRSASPTRSAPGASGLYEHELQGRVIELSHAIVVPFEMTKGGSWDCVVVAEKHPSYPVGGYHLSIPGKQLVDGVVHLVVPTEDKRLMDEKASALDQTPRSAAASKIEP